MPRCQERSQKFSFRHKVFSSLLLPVNLPIWFVLPPGYQLFAYALSPGLWCYATPFLSFLSSRLGADATILTYLLFQRLREVGTKDRHFITNLRTEERRLFLILLHQLGLLPLLTRIRHEDHFVKVSILWSQKVFWGWNFLHLLQVAVSTNKS